MTFFPAFGCNVPGGVHHSVSLYEDEYIQTVYYEYTTGISHTEQISCRRHLEDVHRQTEDTRIREISVLHLYPCKKLDLKTQPVTIKLLIKTM